MKITLNNPVSNTLFNAEAINRSLYRGKDAQGAMQREDRDQAVISPVGKASSLIEQLMKQKDNLLEQKNSLIERATKEGGSGEALQEQLKAIDEQMADIDQQITQAMSEQMTKNADKVMKSDDDEPKTKEEVEKERMSQIISASAGYSKAQVMSSVKSRVEGEIGVLESEIHSVNGAGSSKQERVNDLKDISENLSAEIGDQLNEVQESVAGDEQIVVEKDDDRTVEDIREEDMNNEDQGEDNREE